MRTGILILVALLVLGGLVIALGGPEDEPVRVAEPGEPVAGRSPAEWEARYWQWLLGLPAGDHPAHDPTGARCGTGQEAPVFFVPPNYPPCRVPVGAWVALPVASGECSTVEAPPQGGDTDDDLRACAATQADRYGEIVVRIDGEEVSGIEEYRVAAPVFSITLPEQNLLGVPAGEARVAADGYVLLLEPMAPGTHEISVHLVTVDGLELPEEVLTLTVVRGLGWG